MVFLMYYIHIETTQPRISVLVSAKNNSFGELFLSLEVMQNRHFVILLVKGKTKNNWRDPYLYLISLCSINITSFSYDLG